MACPSAPTIESTLFLGCTILNFSCSLGRNEQVSTLDVNLIEDDCASPPGKHKVYYDIENFPQNPKRQWTAADPGLKSFGINNDEYPKSGAPCYFRYGDFEFCGLLQEWSRSDVKSSKKVYTVKLVSPVEILAGTRVIIGDYAGAVKGFNILNVYGFQEYFSGKSCPPWIDTRYPQDGIIFGSQSGGIGGALRNDGGMPWSKINQGISILTSSFINSASFGLSQYSEYGRICGKGGNENAKFGLLSPDFTNLQLNVAFGISTNVASYIIDLSEIPNTINDARIIGPDLSLLELITEITNIVGYDYYIELLPVYIGTTLYKVIKVRTISMATQPTIGIVEQYVNNVNEVVSSSYGIEFINNRTTNFLIGGQKQNIWQVEQGAPEPETDPDESYLDSVYGNNTYVRERIVPFYGTDSEGNVYVEYEDADDKYINLDIRALRPHLNTINLVDDFLRLDFTEIVMAGGGFDSWIFYTALANTDFFQAFNAAGIDMPVVFNTSALIDFTIDKLKARDLMRLAQSNKYIDDLIRRDLQTIFGFVKTIYDTYSSYFMVRLPNISGVYNGDELILSDEIADGGWTDASNVLGLPNPGGLVDVFKNSDGTIKPIASFDELDGTGGFSSMIGTPEAPVLVLTNTVFTSVEVEPKILFLDNVNLKSARAIVHSPQVEEIEELDFIFNGWSRVPARIQSLLIEAQIGGKIVNVIREDLEAELAKFAQGPRIITPTRIAITTKSNVETYGPWKPNNILESGPPGGINIDKDDSLVPWTYGSLTELNTVAQAKVNVGVSVMDESETGSVEIANIPSVPLGSELASVNGLNSQYYNTNQHLFENREFFSTSYSLDDPDGNNSSFASYGIVYSSWQGNYGPPVTGIVFNVSPDKISTTYYFKTFSPKFGYLSKLNADRIAKRLYLNNQQRKIVRLERAIKELRGLSSSSFNKLTRKLSAAEHKNWHNQQGTPHSLLVGEISDWSSDSSSIDSDFRRTIVSSKPIPEILNNMGPTGTGVSANNYFDNLAIMSWDGLIRPVSMDGDGGLPQYAVPTGNDTDKNLSRGAHPYFADEDTYKHTIDVDYLNPFSNPTSKKRSSINERHSGDTGHDIDILARGTLNDFSDTDNSLIMPTDKDGYNSPYRADYDDDYRLLSLRGPMLVHGWGYDIDGKPVPNSSDTEADAEQGKFVKSGLTDKFYPDFMRKSHMWPVGPVDLRYDRERGVWTSPQRRRPLCAMLTSNIPALGDGTAKVLDSQTYYDADGNTIVDKTINVRDCINVSYNSGTRVIVDYDEYNKIYRIVESPASGTKSTSVIPFKFISCMPAGGPGSGIQIIVDENDNEIAVGEPFRLQCIHDHMWGPCPSGYRGWASTAGLNITGTGISADFNYSIINCETLPEYIEFQAESGFLSDTVDAYVTYSWNGGTLQNEYVKVTLPGYITQSAFIPGSENVRGTAVINRRRTQDQNFDYNDACNYSSYYYDVIELFGISASGSTNIANPMNPPLPGDRFGLLEFGSGLSIEKKDTNHLLISTSGGNAEDMYYFQVIQYNPSVNMITASGIDNLPGGSPIQPGPFYVYDKFGASWITGERGFCIFDTGAYVGAPYGVVNWSTLREHRGRNFKLISRKITSYDTAEIQWLDKDLVVIPNATESIYDPHHKYSGLNGAKGKARLVSDPKNHKLRWEIEELAAPAMLICATLDEEFNGSSIDATLSSYMGPDWSAENPGATVKVESCLFSHIDDGATVVGYRKDPDSDPPIYNIISILQGGGGGGCNNAITGITCGLDYSDGYLTQTLYLKDCTGTTKTTSCLTPIELPGLECDPLTGVTCNQSIDSNVITTTLYLNYCTGSSKTKSCSITIPTGNGGGCSNAINDISCSVDEDVITISWVDCTGGVGSTTCNLTTTTVPVITGCASPFVTFDSAGNPTWHFAYANVKILGTDGGGTTDCSAAGTNVCA